MYYRSTLWQRTSLRGGGAGAGLQKPPRLAPAAMCLCVRRYVWQAGGAGVTEESEHS